MRVEHRIEYLASPRLLPHLPRVLRLPVKYWRAARAEWKIARENEVAFRRLRASGRPWRLELGSGPVPGRNGWTTVDLRAGCDLRLDLRPPLPFHDNEIEEIYSSHALEYFGYDEILQILREWRRILRPGGTLRLALPNARLFIEGYREESGFDAERFCVYKPALHSPARIDVVNYMAYMDAHRHMFDEENLPAMLREAGFAEAALRGFDAAVDKPERQFESLYAQAIKPLVLIPP